jgi:hypothetical protein
MDTVTAPVRALGEARSNLSKGYGAQPKTKSSGVNGTATDDTGDE